MEDDFGERTQKYCVFCARMGSDTMLVHSPDGLICPNPQCFSRIGEGRMVPATACPNCGEHAFEMRDDSPHTETYVCISCGHRTVV